MKEDINNAEDREYEVVAFTFDMAYDIIEEPSGRKWWQFWKPKVNEIMVPQATFWHYSKELEPTGVEVTTVCLTPAQYLRHQRLLPTVPEEFDWPPAALVPLPLLAEWSTRHRAYLVTTDGGLYTLDRFITLYGVPESN